MALDGPQVSAQAEVREQPHDSDELLLASLGYKQEFRRVFTPAEVFGVGFGIIGLVPSYTSVLVYAIPNGGAVAMVWGWTVCAFFLGIIGLAMAELGSAAPTTGGLYYWTYMFSPRKWRCLLSWLVGYSNTVGNVASVASVDWGLAVQIMAAASIGADQKFSATTGETFAVFVGILLLHAITCSLNPVIIARLQIPFIVANIALCLIIIIGVPSATPSVFKNSASYAFGNFQNSSGWPNGFAFILSFLTPLWTIGAFDSTVHISEEATNASTAIPWAIILAATSSGALGWAINVALTFNMGIDLKGILSNPIGQPMATILFNSFGKQGTLAIWSLIIVVQFTMGIGMLTTASRQLFAFARDGALPFSSYLYTPSPIYPRKRAPIACVWAVAFVSLLLCLLAFAGANAIGAIFSLVITGQYFAYSVPISARMLGRWRGGAGDIKRGSFDLGRWSTPVAALAVVWMVFIIVVFLFPTSPHPTSSNMNYTVVVWGGTLALSLAYFYFPVYGGMYWFKGPVQTINNRTGEDLGEGERRDGYLQKGSLSPEEVDEKQENVPEDQDQKSDLLNKKG